MEEEYKAYRQGRIDALRDVYAYTQCSVTEEFIESLLRAMNALEDGEEEEA